MYSVLYSPSCIVHREEHRALDYYSTVQIELAPPKTEPNDGYVWASTVITRQDSSDLSFSFVSLSLFFFIANPNLILFYVIVMLGFRLYLRVISLILPNFISI